MSVEKTVFVLGAGASASACLPTQAGLLDRVFSLNHSSFSHAGETDDFLELQIQKTPRDLHLYYAVFDQYRRVIGNFIVSYFASNDKKNRFQVAMNKVTQIEAEEDSVEKSIEKDEYLAIAYEVVRSINVSLEDLFTIFDSVAAGRDFFRQYSVEEMNGLHFKLKMCIIYALSYAISQGNTPNDYEHFAEYLIKKRLSVTQKEDNISVITMNWDDVLERAVYKSCASYNLSINKGQIKVLPDLCFYDYDYHTKEGHIPSTHIKAKGHKNIKLLKMHGSLAWLECPKCGRIFTDFENEIACDEFAEAECPYCKAQEDIKTPKLRSLIITPTFLKSLDNLNVKNIWHNAFLDLSEADHIVFIGYSFPDADFEMRCLLKKATKETADITVVLTESNDPRYYREYLGTIGCDSAKIKNIVEGLALPEYRYNSFFGEDRVKYQYGGFKKYLEELGE